MSYEIRSCSLIGCGDVVYIYASMVLEGAEAVAAEGKFNIASCNKALD